VREEVSFLLLDQFLENADIVGPGNLDSKNMVCIILEKVAVE